MQKMHDTGAEMQDIGVSSCALLLSLSTMCCSACQEPEPHVPAACLYHQPVLPCLTFNINQAHIARTSQALTPLLLVPAAPGCVTTPGMSLQLAPFDWAQQNHNSHQPAPSNNRKPVQTISLFRPA